MQHCERYPTWVYSKSELNKLHLTISIRSQHVADFGYILLVMLVLITNTMALINPTGRTNRNNEGHPRFRYRTGFVGYCVISHVATIYSTALTSYRHAIGRHSSWRTVKENPDQVRAGSRPAGHDTLDAALSRFTKSGTLSLATQQEAGLLYLSPFLSSIGRTRWLSWSCCVCFIESKPQQKSRNVEQVGRG